MSTEPLPLDKEQIPVKASDTPLPLREDQIPVLPLVVDNKPSTTTLQQDIGADSRRAVNLIWEKNQERLSLLSLIVSMLVCSALALNGLRDNATQAQLALASTGLTFLITTSMIITNHYFLRTNHEKIGGVGSTPAERNEGRSGNT